MANISKTIEIIFGAKNELSSTVNDISKKFDDLDSSVSKITEPLSRVFDSVVKVDAALAALAIGGMALAIKESSTFNNSFALISTSITATGGDLTKYRDDVLKYSTSSVKSLEDINASLYTAAQAGVKYTESIDFIVKAEQLAVANKANLNTTVDLLTGTMNAYGFTIKDVGKLNDVFFESTLIGKQTIDQLGQSMGMVVGIAANSGVSFEDLSAAIATLTAKGLETSEAITAVKGVITTLISPSKEAKEAAAALGLNFSLTELKAKGFAGMLSEIMTKTGGSAEKMVALFNEVRAMNGALSITGDGMKFFNDALKNINNSAGASEAAYQKMVGTFANQSQMVINTAKGMMISIGTEIEPVAAKIGGGLASLFAGVKIGVDAGAFDPLFTALEQAGSDLAKWLKDIGKVMPEALAMLDFDKLIEAFGALGDAVGAYFGGLDLTKADDLATAMQTVIDIITGLVNVTAGMADAFRPFVIQIVEFFKAMANGDEESQRTIGKILSFAKAIKSAGLAVVAAIFTIDELGVSMKALFEIFAGGGTVMWNAFTIALNVIKGGFLELENIIVTFIDEITFHMIPGVKELKGQIAQQLEGVNKSIITDLTDAGNGVDKLAAGFNHLGTETGNTSEKAKTLYEHYKKLPDKVETTVALNNYELSAGNIKAFYDTVVDIPPKIDVTLGAKTDMLSLGHFEDNIQRVTKNGEEIWTYIGVKTDEPSMTKTKKEIDDALKERNHEIDVKLKYDETRLKEQSDIIQKSLEWKAKVDIAEAEAGAKKFASMFESINKGMESTGGMLTSLFGMLDRTASSSTYQMMVDQIKSEAEVRKGTFEMQKRLIDSQITLQDAKTKAISSGAQVIQVQGAGLQPHLEAIMWEILKAIQIRANESGAEFLLGMVTA